MKEIITDNNDFLKNLLIATDEVNTTILGDAITENFKLTSTYNASLGYGCELFYLYDCGDNQQEDCPLFKTLFEKLWACPI